MAETLVKKVAKKVVAEVGKGRKPSVSKIMLEEGYSPGYSKNPQRLTTQKAFTEILDEAGLTTEFLAKETESLAKAESIEYLTFNDDQFADLDDSELQSLVESFQGVRFVRIIRKKGARATAGRRVYYAAPDKVIRRMAVEMAMKARGLIKGAGEEGNTTINFNRINQTNIQIVDEKRAEHLDAILKDNA